MKILMNYDEEHNLEFMHVHSWTFKLSSITGCCHILRSQLDTFKKL